MVMRWLPLFLFILLGNLPVLLFAPISSQGFEHEKVEIRGSDGSSLTIDSKVPYSPRKTCGACHDYEQITKGYHFQQGRADRSGNIVIRDTFDPKYPWNLSPGMFGKYSPAQSMRAS